MELNDARITILVNSEFTTIEVHDGASNQQFVSIKLTPEQLSKCLSRLSYVKCECSVHGLDKIGKTQENKDFVFEIPEDFRQDKEKVYEKAKEELEKSGMTDWRPDEYFGSQSSFFTGKNGKQFAKAIIRRWV